MKDMQTSFNIAMNNYLTGSYNVGIGYLAGTSGFSGTSGVAGRPQMWKKNVWKYPIKKGEGVWSLRPRTAMPLLKIPTYNQVTIAGNSYKFELPTASGTDGMDILAKDFNVTVK